jgi:hypothetical protein
MAFIIIGAFVNPFFPQKKKRNEKLNKNNCKQKKNIPSIVKVSNLKKKFFFRKKKSFRSSRIIIKTIEKELDYNVKMVRCADTAALHTREEPLHNKEKKRKNKKSLCSQVVCVCVCVCV